VQVSEKEKQEEEAIVQTPEPQPDMRISGSWEDLAKVFSEFQTPEFKERLRARLSEASKALEVFRTVPSEKPGGT
jgi:hypothetical protein